MTQDTRKDPRAKIVSLNVRYKSATVDEFIENHSHDVSKGGIFIKTSTPFPQGTLLKFEIRLSGDQAVIAGVGRVVWKREAGSASGDSPAGMGVKFIKIDEASRAVIDKLVGSREDAGSAFTSEIANEKPEVGKGTLLGTGAPAPAATAAPRPGGVAAPVKSTLIGMAAVTLPKTGPSSPTPAAGSPPAAKPAAGEGAKTAMGGFFPATNSEADMPAPQERTMMKQAAELLEEALKGAGGSMDEVGTNPLFAGPAGTPETPKAEPPKPAEKAAPTDIGVARPAVEPVPVTRRDSPAAKESERPAPSERPAAPSDRPAATQDKRASERPAATQEKRSERPQAVRAADVVEPQRKGGSGALLWVAVLLLIGGGLVYAYKGGWLGGEKPVTTTPTAEPSSPPSATETASAPSATQSAAVVAPLLTDASALAATQDAGKAKDAGAATTVGTTTAATATTTAAPTATPTPKPPVPKPPVPKPTETAASTATTAPTTAPTETAAPTAKPPTPKPKPTATDSDNPY